MKGYGQFCPVAKAAEIVAERWTPLVLRELLCGSRRDELDAGLLMWDIHRRVNVDALPPERVVVRLDFRGAPATMRCPRTWWLVLARSEVDLCLRDPGFPVDVVMTADLKTLTRVWMGDVPMAAALHAGSIRLEGPPSLVRAFPTWLRLSSFARVERVATTAAAR
jgi:hypothetical protein